MPRALIAFSVFVLLFSEVGGLASSAEGSIWESFDPSNPAYVGSLKDMPVKQIAKHESSTSPENLENKDLPFAEPHLVSEAQNQQPEQTNNKATDTSSASNDLHNDSDAIIETNPTAVTASKDETIFKNDNTEHLIEDAQKLMAQPIEPPPLMGQQAAFNNLSPSSEENIRSERPYLTPIEEAPDPFKILEALNQLQNQSIDNSLLSGASDPSGSELEKDLPLNVPLLDRQNDILDPIELDVNPTRTLTLSLEKALLMAIKANIPQRILNETVYRDRWRFWSATSALLPDIFLNYRLINRTNNTSPTSGGAALNSGSNANTLNQAGFSINYNLSAPEIFNAIATYYDWQTNVQFTGAGLQDTMRLTINRYYDVLRSRAELAVRIEAVKQARVQTELNERLERGGVGTKFAVLQAKTQLAENELALLNQQSLARIAEIALMNSIAVPLGTNLSLDESQLYKKTLVSPDYSIDELVKFAKSGRPDLARRKYAIKAAENRLIQSWTEILPSFTAEYFQTSSSPSFSPALDTRNYSQFRQSTLGLTMPIVRGGGLFYLSTINQRRAEFRQAKLELLNDQFNIEQQVRESFLRTKSTEKQILAAERQLNAATEAIKLARVRLQTGIGTNIDLIDAQRNYVNALVNKVRAVIEYNQSQVDILRSTGQISPDTVLKGTLSFKMGGSYLPAATVTSQTNNGFKRARYGP
ncbi:MAG: TolC family protein [Candidatus Caenarcaniphilales bacterium]|nr:TolC family protein [Candidatus Caenarcaniphilales bacterium]